MYDDDDETATATERNKMAPYLPPELVWAIMARLPVKSLLRFRCVCKAWNDRISDDTEFHSAHLRVQTPCLFTWSRTKEDKVNKVTTISLYASRESLALEHTMELPLEDESHYFANCDGLMLMPTETVVRVLNPATRRVLTLPWSPNNEAPPSRFYDFLTHQVFGIGHAPRSNTYKVARFFFRSMDPVLTGSDHHNFGMEVFTIGIDRDWRQTVVQPPYPVPAEIIGRTATFFKGSLFWTIDEDKLAQGESSPGFLRFKLEDESFGVTPPPPGCQGLRYATSYMSVLRGELSVAHAGPKYESIEIWMCNDVDTNPPRWNQRYSFNTFHPLTNELFKSHMYYRCRSFLLQLVLEGMLGVNGPLKYHSLNSIIPYIPSLVPLL